MVETIYIDVYFCLNFLMDFTVLFITGILIKSRKKIYWITTAAALGALYSVMILILNAKGLMSLICTYLVMAYFMCVIAFGKNKVKRSIHNVIVLYVVTFSVSGGLNSIYYGTGFGKTFMEKATQRLWGNISIVLTVSIVVVLLTFFALFRDRICERLKSSSCLFPVSICVGTAKIKVMALCDTGNSLTEPVTKKPVSIIDKDEISPFNSEKLRLLVIPYKTVGKNAGIMYGFIADSLEVNGRVIKKPIIGISQGNLSRDKSYEMILHPKMIEKGE